MKVTLNQVYTSVACNRKPEIVDWNGESFICFGATNAVVIYDTKQKYNNPLTVLCHHTAKVNSVRWLYKEDGSCTEFVSCSADKTAAVWSFDNVWTVTETLTGHTDGVTCVNGVYIYENCLLVFTASIDSTIRIWERCNGLTKCKQIINLNSGLCLTLHPHLLGTKRPALFCALDDHKIHVFAGAEEFHRVHVLIGHEDWVRGLDVLHVDDSTILLASASQDTYIRLWRIQKYIKDDRGFDIRVEEKVFEAYDQVWSVKLDAVLAGHEGWVYGIQFQPHKVFGNKKQPIYRLLSSSLDKTLIVWEPDSVDEGGQGAWVERVRVGEVGGNGLGFYGSRFGPNGTSFMGHGYNGTFHMWHLDEETGQWLPSVVCGGHFGPVEDIKWEPDRGRYLISVSSDQTTRIHAPWRRDNGESWHELSRAQVHGYDIMGVAALGGARLVSAADEKVLRVFEAPAAFAHHFRAIVGEPLLPEDVVSMIKHPEGASVPSLGLSNKADADGEFTIVDLTEPPTEETLLQNTLWPEVQKLYGHGYEVYTVASSFDGALLASACRATTPEHAAVFLWDTSNWKQIQQLVSHQLTVTQLEFSPDGDHLLSVSRDRRWTIYRRQQGANSFTVAATIDKTNGVHTRILWCCAWSHDSTLFATGSRDGKVCVWSRSNTVSQSSLKEYALKGEPLDLSKWSVTAVAFAPKLIQNQSLVAAGFENGLIRLYLFNGGWNLIHEMNNSAAHHLTVKRLIFNPKEAKSGGLSLASCGSDHLVRIYNIIVH